MINIVQINMEERLQKYLAECGIASRRKCEEYIIQGKVQVNGKTITELGVKVNPEKDKITFEGKNVKQEERKVYILLNKPIGYVTTSDEQFGRDKVLDLVKVRERVVPVGRLDMYTSGALILTNDGDFVYKVTHPKHEITKTYTVTVKGIIKNEEVEQLRKGVKIDDYTTRPAKVKILKTDEEKDIFKKIKVENTDSLLLNEYIEEYKLLTIREFRMMRRIMTLEKSKTDMTIGSIKKKNNSQGNIETTTEAEATLDKIQRIEDGLTRVTEAKRKSRENMIKLGFSKRELELKEKQAENDLW